MMNFARGVLHGVDLEDRDDILANAILETRFGWFRMTLLTACVFAIGEALSFGAAVTWCALIIIAEAIHFWTSRAVVRRRPIAPHAFVATSAGIAVSWAGLGVILWNTTLAPMQMAAIAICAVSMIYASAFCYHSIRVLTVVVAPHALVFGACFLSMAFQHAIGTPTILLLFIAFGGAGVACFSAAAAHLSYVRMWEARLALRAERDALEERVCERTAELVAATERAEAASVAKSNFLANMSHELRTPLNAVIGYAEMLAEDLETEGLDSLRGDADRIRNSGKHLLKLINEVLDLSKIEANRLDLDYELNDIGRIMREIADSLQLIAGERRNRIDLKVAPGLPHIWTDGLRLHQCVLNLASNACKFTEGGLISIAAEERVREDGAFLVVTVRDTGIGIAPEQLEKLFQPFVQAEASTTRRFGGTGLGLSITRQLARLMGGDVTVQSALSQGSCFELSLPIQAAPAVKAPQTKNEQKNEGVAAA